MRRGYSQDIRADVITKRLRGYEWKEIQKEVESNLEIKPSIRQMQKWVANYKRGAKDPTGLKEIATEITQSTKKAILLSEATMSWQVSRNWTRLMHDYTLEADEALLMTFIYFWELELGRQGFQRVLNRYKGIRDKFMWYTDEATMMINR